MKVVIIGGAGGIGSSAAFNLLSAQGTYEIVLVDTRPNMITSHVMDQENALALGATPDTVRGGTPEDTLDADVVVLSAAVPLRLNSSRSVFLADNAAIVDQCLRPLRDSDFGGVVLMLTNPVDPLLTWAHRQGWLPRHRLVGYTLNDSLRLRTGIAHALGVHPQDVGAWMLGEHGEGQVPLYSRITVGGESVVLTDEQRAMAEEYADSWYSRHVALDSGRTSTWTTGLGTARLIEAMATGSGTVVPASVVLDGEYGVHGVSLGVPVELGRDGVRRVVEWDLAPGERRGMQRAAVRVEAAVADLDGVSAAR
ncbi:malate dehydrogenase [Streptomyces acidiscabies]|uniref:malate dehydrogenase n=1 Tax=Streptomyces acidiscabies TaxID=42234 RepID=UPI00073E466F|nr:malate dehydrogenase [Streptomyces acidiscabies]GAQ55278.1 L-lactate dehydrogenase 1 [Streptomyces acidiscabies]GAV40547.1 L-lactate dehydrogenase 1 [Streptomyces acidiscabies]